MYSLSHTKFHSDVHVLPKWSSGSYSHDVHFTCFDASGRWPLCGGKYFVIEKKKIVSSCRAQQSNLINKSMAYRQCFIGDLCPIVQQNIAIVCRTTVITPQTWIDVTEMCGSSAPKLLIAGLLVRVAKKYSTMNKWTSWNCGHTSKLAICDASQQQQQQKTKQNSAYLIHRRRYMKCVRYLEER